MKLKKRRKKKKERWAKKEIDHGKRPLLTSLATKLVDNMWLTSEHDKITT